VAPSQDGESATLIDRVALPFLSGLSALVRAALRLLGWLTP
jgi:hypothetical protein